MANTNGNITIACVFHFLIYSRLRRNSEKEQQKENFNLEENS